MLRLVIGARACARAGIPGSGGANERAGRRPHCQLLKISPNPYAHAACGRAGESARSLRDPGCRAVHIGNDAVLLAGQALDLIRGGLRERRAHESAPRFTECLQQGRNALISRAIDARSSITMPLDHWCKHATPNLLGLFGATCGMCCDIQPHLNGVACWLVVRAHERAKHGLRCGCLA
jgi:hypothetical protein